MQKILFIVIFSFIFFILQFLMFNLLGRFFMPHLLLLLVIFVTLFFGVRYGVFTAFLCGFLLDSYSGDTFGLNVLILIACSYLVVILRKYMYLTGSRGTIYFLVLTLVCTDVVWKFFTHALSGYVDFSQTFLFVFLPEVITTLFLCHIVFKGLRQCASRLSV
jgi:rod shape-determining protein MreD